MKLSLRSIIAVLLTGIWVNASEFFRNEVLLQQYWIDHYKSLGLTFPSEAKNGMAWIVWGFLFAGAIYLISRKFTLLQTTIIIWFMAFVMMWIIIWNLNVLPTGIIFYAVPLCLLEAFVGSYICKKVYPV
jgi:hypothetical protein